MESISNSWRRLRVGGALAFAVALVATGCSTGGEANDAETTLTVAISADPRSMAPTSTTVQQELNVSEQITEKLIEFAPNGIDYEARLATAWETVDDSTVRLTLRQGVKFSNGEDFNAESAKLSIEALRDAPAYAASVSMISGVRVLGDHEIEVFSDKPTGLLLTALAMGSFQYPHDYWSEAGEKGYGTAPVGTGPYLLSKWSRGDSISMERNPDYWGDRPAIANLQFQVIPDKPGQVAALRSGQIDLMFDVPVSSAAEIENDQALEIASLASNRAFTLTFNTNLDTPVAKPEVRRALAHAIDVDALVANQLQGRATALAGQMITPNYFGFNPDLKPIKYDPTMAKKLLAEAGYPDGFELTFKYSNGRYIQDKETGQAIADQLAKVGVRVVQQVMEPGAFVDELLKLKLNDIFLLGTLLPPDAQFMYQMYKTGGVYGYYSDAEADALIQIAATSGDSATREKALRDVGKRFQENPPAVPLFQSDDTYAMSAKVEGFVPRVTQFIDYRSVTVK